MIKVTLEKREPQGIKHKISGSKPWSKHVTHLNSEIQMAHNSKIATIKAPGMWGRDIRW